MSLLGSPFQVIVSTAADLTVEAGTDAVIVTASKAITLPLARNCTLEQGNNVIRIVGAGGDATVGPTSPDTLATGDSTTVIEDGNVGIAESDGLSMWFLTGSKV
jgi:hypothetical protein